MRYVVTGAAGFIGSHLAEALQSPRRTRSSGFDCFTDYYDPRAEGGERPRARRPARRPRRGRARLRRLRRRLPPRRPAGRAQLRRRLPALPAPQRARVAARVRGRRARRRPGRVRLLVVGLRRGRAVPDARGRRRRSRSRRTAITKLACEQLARRVRAGSSGSTRVVAALLQRVRPAPAARHGVHADRVRARRRDALRALRRRVAVAQLDVRLRRRRRDDRARCAAAAGPTTSAARSRRR